MAPLSAVSLCYGRYKNALSGMEFGGITQVGKLAVDGLPAAAGLPLGALHGLLLADQSAGDPSKQLCTQTMTLRALIRCFSAAFGTTTNFHTKLANACRTSSSLH